MIAMDNNFIPPTDQEKKTSIIDIAALNLWVNQGEEQTGRDFPVAQLLQLVLDNIPQAVFWKNRDSVYVWCNRNFAFDAGVGMPDNIVGKTDHDLAWTREQADFFYEVDQRVMENNTPEYQFIEPQTQADGKQAWLVTNKIPLHDREGNIVGILGTYEDITERREAEQALQRAHDELEMRVKERTTAEREQRTLAEALRDTAALLNSTLNLDEVLDRILTAIGRVVPHETANIILVEGSQVRVVRYRDQIGGHAMSQKLDRTFSLEELPNLVEMAATHEPMILADTSSASNWVERPDTKWVRSYLGAPIEVDGKVIGFINLNSETPKFFNLLHVEHLRIFANQAAIAIDNARLYKQAQELAAIEERQRLARDLHDAVSQTLWTASLIAEVLPALWEQDQEEGQQSLEKLRRLTQGALAEMRTLLLELRPTALVESRLGDLLHQLVQATRSRKKIEIALKVEGETKLPPDVQIGIYRIAQEVLNNVVKHARAAHVEMRLICHPDEIDLFVRDDGRGFNQKEITARQLGLEIMRERAAAIGATLELSSQVGEGTRIHLRWPEIQEETERK